MLSTSGPAAAGRFTRLRRCTAAATLALALPLLGAAPAAAAGEGPGSARKTSHHRAAHGKRFVNVQLLAINDFHGHLKPPAGSTGAINVPTTPENPTGRVEAGGAEYLATHIRRLRATNRNSIVVGAGDLIGGSPLLSALFHDEPSIEALDLMGLEFSSVGNHEFDEGARELLRMQYGGCHPVDGCQDGDGFEGAAFHYLAANVADEEDHRDTILPPFAIKRIGKVRVGFIGMTLEGTPGIVSPGGIQGLDFLDEAETANRYARILKRRGVDAIVVLLHEGLDQSGGYNECKGASGAVIDIVHRMHPEIDVVVTGHTHEAYNCVIDDRLVTSASSFGRLVTDIDLRIERRTGEIVRSQAENVIVTRDVAKAADVSALIAKYDALAGPLENRVIGELTAAAPRAAAPSGESILGNLIADAQLAATAPANLGGAQIAFMNPGGIRADLDAGPVTYGESFTVQPFGNNLTTLTLTGAQIDTLLEQQWQGQANPRILQVSSGFTYAWNPNAPVGERVDPASIKLNGETLSPTGTYRVTVNSFLAGGGDNFTVLTSGTDVLGGVVDVDALEAYFAAAGGAVTPPALGRITQTP